MSRSHEYNCPRHLAFKLKSKTVTKCSPFPCNPSSETSTSRAIPNTEVEPAIAVGKNPLKCNSDPMVVFAYHQDRYTSSGGANANYMKISLDGGDSFGDAIPLPVVICYGGKYERDTDPHVAIDGDGFVYFSGLPFDVVKSGAGNVAVGKYDVLNKKFIYVKLLDEESFDDPIPAATDYEFIIVDPQSPHKKAVYATWLVGFYNDPTFVSAIRFSKTVDGNIWTPFTNVVNPQVAPDSGIDIDEQAQNPMMGLLPNIGADFSRIVVVYAFVIGSNTDRPISVQFRSTFSLDQGLTWSSPVAITPPGASTIEANGIAVDPDTLTNPPLIPIRAGNLVPIIATDRKRNIAYVVTQENSLLYTPPVPSGIFLYVSADGANSWIPIGQVNRIKNTQAFNQSIAILDNGVIAISYYDFRFYRDNNPNSPLLTDRWMAFYCYDSVKQSVTFIKEIRLTKQSFNIRKAPLLTSGSALVPAGYFLADYTEQTNYKGKLYSVYPIVPEHFFNNNTDIKLSLIDYDENCDW